METTRCEVCGATGEVGAVMAYVGGHGHQERRRCVELFACWIRFNAEQDKQEAAGAASAPAAKNAEEKTTCTPIVTKRADARNQTQGDQMIRRLMIVWLALYWDGALDAVLVSVFLLPSG